MGSNLLKTWEPRAVPNLVQMKLLDTSLPRSLVYGLLRSDALPGFRASQKRRASLMAAQEKESLLRALEATQSRDAESRRASLPVRAEVASSARFLLPPLLETLRTMMMMMMMFIVIYNSMGFAGMGHSGQPITRFERNRKCASVLNSSNRWILIG